MKQSFSASWPSIAAAFFGFFIMGFVDVVGIATNYVKNDFGLTAKVAAMLPMLVFLWFAVFPVPVGILMGKAGRKKTVLIALAVTAAAMVLPYLFYNFSTVLAAFILLGISNTILQVALNPLVAAMFTKEKTASVLSTGQFIKAVSSFLGPIIAGFSAAYFGDWKLTFVIFSIVSILSLLLLITAEVKETQFENQPASIGGTLGLLKDKFVLFCFLCIFLLVGFDVGMNVSIPELLMKKAGLTLENAGYGTSIYFAARTFGSFMGAVLLLKTKPARFLIVSLVVAVVAFPLLMLATNAWLLWGLIFLIGLSIANVFSIIFAFALQRFPDRANEISALLIMGVVGGAVIPFVQGMLNDSAGLMAALAVILICLVLILFITLYLRKHV